MGAAALGVDHQRPRLHVDPALVEAKQVVAVGLESLLPLAIDEAERLRPEVLVDVGLAAPAGVGAADQAGEPVGPDPRAIEVAEDALVDLLLGAAKRGDLLLPQAAALVVAEARGDRPPHLGGALQQLAERAGPAGGVEPHGQVDLRAHHLAALELASVLGQVSLEALGVSVAAVEGPQRPAHVCLGVEGARDAQDLEVRLDDVGERLQALGDLDLPGVREARIALALDLVHRPGVDRRSEDEVPPEEVVGRPHSNTTTRPAGIRRVLPWWSGAAPAGFRSRQSAATAIRSSRLSPTPRGTPSSSTATG